MPKVSFLLALGFFIFRVYTSAISPPRFAGSWISGTYFFFSSANGFLICFLCKCYVAFSGTYFFF